MRRKAATLSIRILLVFGSFSLINPFLHAEDYIFNSAGVKTHDTVEGKGGAGGCPLFWFLPISICLSRRCRNR
jgi:hypothetical protein